MELKLTPNSTPKHPETHSGDQLKRFELVIDGKLKQTEDYEKI